MDSRYQITHAIKILLYVVLLSTLLFINAAVRATSVIEVSLEDMLQYSELVFEGQVIDLRVRELGNHGIQTQVTFEVIDIIKGEIKGKRLTLGFLGGAIGEKRLVVSNMHMPVLNEHGIYFVESAGRNLVQPLYGWSQGHLIIEKDAAGKEQVFTRSGRPVRGIEHTNGKRTGRLSHGAARGLLLGDPGDVSGALDKKDFKRLLRAMQ